MDVGTEGSGLGEVLRRLDELIDWEQRERAPSERGQAMRVDLAPIEDLASLAGRPDRGLCVVHVAGSKGKGSVASLVAAGLRAAGLRVGRYGSPHVERIHERIELDGEEIGDDALAAALGTALDMRDAAVMIGSDGKDATWFDVLTLAAMLAMRDAGIRFAVFECGLGGRLDSTNLLVGEVCVVTSIELEHTAILGSTRAEIAFEKVSILGQAATLVTGVADESDEAGRTIARHAEMMGSRILRPDWTADPTSVSIEERNVSLAGLVLDELGERGWAASKPASAVLLTPERIAEARLPGRLEVLEWQGIPVVLDGAHTPASLESVFADLAARPELDARPVVIFGAAKDKDLTSMLKVLAGRTDRVVCSSAGSRTAAPLEELVENARRFVAGAEMASVPRMALTRAAELCHPGGWILITGSLHLVGALRPIVSTHRPC
jgi:dihydrofolate synthase/folylpolyglutamate synthase